MDVNKIYNTDCLSGLWKIPDSVIDCCISSPPYWGLRDYGVEGQLGLEPKFETYIHNLCEIYGQIYRVLKPEGTCFVNIGDTYGGSGKGVGGTTSKESFNFKKLPKVESNIADKCLCQIPSRFAISMSDNGWILRNEIIWHKPNGMPTSARDRFTVDFEKIFFFVKQKKYYFNQQFEPYTAPMNRWGGDRLTASGDSTWDNGTGQNSYRDRNMRPNPEGRNMRSVWSINTKPLHDAHFATFPTELVHRMIMSRCPENGIVLDPFMGAGTTALVAKRTNRNYIGFELNQDYIDIANNRLYKYFGIFN